MFFEDTVQAEYRSGGGSKQRVLSLSYLGNLRILKQGRPETQGSSSDHLANLREVTRGGSEVKLTFTNRTWSVTCSSAEQASFLLKAIVTLGMILHQGPPLFVVADTAQGEKLDLAQYHFFAEPTREYLVNQNLPFGWELSYMANAANSPPTPYYIQQATQQSFWELPPDAIEQIPINSIKKYPRYLADGGFFMALRMWCAHLFWQWDIPCAAHTSGEHPQAPHIAQVAPFSAACVCHPDGKLLLFFESDFPVSMLPALLVSRSC